MNERAGNRRYRALWAAAVAVAAAGCSTIIEPSPEERPGVIDFYQEPVVVEAPETVRAGAPFEVSVRTYGGGCLSKGETEVRKEGLSVDVRPHDIHSGADVCTQELKMFDHRATVTLHDAGVAEIRFHGQAVPGDSAVLVVRYVTVEP